MNMRLRSQHDEVAERAVLGSAMLEPECWITASERLRAPDFYDPKHALIFTALETLGKAGVAIDMLLVRSQLHTSGMLEQAGGDSYLMDLTEHIATVENTERLSKRIQQLAIVRRAQQAALRLADEASQPIEDLGEFIERCSTALTNVCHQRGNDLEVQSLADALHEAYTELAARERSGQVLLGHSTGLTDLDHAIGGLAPGDLIILAARPGAGKTALANTIKLGVARSTGKPVLSLELEMTRAQLSHRVLSTESGVDLRRIRAAALSKHDLDDIARTADDLSKLPVHFIERRATKISELRKAARRLAATAGPLSLIVVDYLQIAKAERREERREREVSDISSQLKSLAGEMQCPVLALSQLNRGVESRADKRPMLSDLRESGSIEQDADTVLFLYRDEMYNPNTPEKGIVEVLISKQRSGPIGFVKLRWLTDLTRFESLLPGEQAPAQQTLYEQHGSNGHRGTAGSRSNGSNGHHATRRDDE